MDRLKLRNTFLPLIAIFVIINTLCLYYQSQLLQHQISPQVIQAGNGILFLLATISALMHYKALKNENPNAFVRSIMGSAVLKLFVIAGSALVYVYITGKARSKSAIMICMGLYIIYSIVEVAGAYRLNKEKNGGR